MTPCRLQQPPFTLRIPNWPARIDATPDDEIESLLAEMTNSTIQRYLWQIIARCGREYIVAVNAKIHERGLCLTRAERRAIVNRCKPELRIELAWGQ